MLALCIVGGIVAGGVAFLVIGFVLAVAGDESFTEDLVRWWIGISGGVAAATLAGVRLWQERVRDDPRTASRSRAGTVVAASTLIALAAFCLWSVNALGRSPVNLEAPRITGVARVGKTLHVSPGRWDPKGGAPLDYIVKWYSCKGDTCQSYETDDKFSYDVTREDVGARISVLVIALGDLNATAESGDTPIVRP
jgi:hypothetical protein